MTYLDQAVHFSVDEAADRLKNVFIVERELLRVLGGYLVSIEDWELKKLIPLHIWQNSLRADFVRKRILELRYPKRDVDSRSNKEQVLIANIEFVLQCTNDLEFLTGVYWVWKTELLAIYKHYVEWTNPLNDEPSLYQLCRFIPELEGQIAEIEVHCLRLEQEKKSLNPSPTKWKTECQVKLDNFNSMLYEELVQEAYVDPSQIKEKSAYSPPAVPIRDSRFTPTTHHNAVGDIQQGEHIDELLERRLIQGISHANEMWAAEVLGVVLWAWEDMPWEFYTDTARWLYDESRHCRMGEERMKQMGFEAGMDYPMAGEGYTALFSHGPEYMLGLLHHFESMVHAKQESKEWFEAAGDCISAENMDYDWADESIHLSYGYKWMLHRLNGDMDKLEQIRDRAGEIWCAWFTENVIESPIQYYGTFRKRMLQKINNLTPHINPQGF